MTNIKSIYAKTHHLTKIFDLSLNLRINRNETLKNKISPLFNLFKLITLNHRLTAYFVSRVGFYVFQALTGQKN